MLHAPTYQGRAGAHDALHVDERDTVDAARAGCNEAFTALVDHYQPQVLRYLTRKTGDQELASDLTQETFLHAYRRLDRLGDDRPFAAWLFRIAHLNLLHEWRRQRVRRLVSLDWLVSEGGEAQEVLQHTDKTTVAHERDLIQEALNALTPTLREPLLLSCLGGFSGQEVADILSISPAAARQRIARAKDQFRQQYQALNAEQHAIAVVARRSDGALCD